MTKFIFFRVSRHYAKGALQYIIPILLQKLTKQEELDDEDDWNPSKAAGVCLMLLATCCEDEIVPHVLPFIKENIKSDNWRFRDASLMAFGSILGGLENNTLRPLVEQVSFNICNHVDHFFFTIIVDLYPYIVILKYMYILNLDFPRLQKRIIYFLIFYFKTNFAVAILR